VREAKVVSPTLWRGRHHRIDLAMRLDIDGMKVLRVLRVVDPWCAPWMLLTAHRLSELRFAYRGVMKAGAFDYIPLFDPDELRVTSR
jgi:hypothetical protein